MHAFWRYRSRADLVVRPRLMPADAPRPFALPRLLPKGAKAEGRQIGRGKLRKAKAEALKRGLVARSCARSGRKDVVGEVKGIEMMGVLIAGRGARERGDRRLEVKVDAKR